MTTLDFHHKSIDNKEYFYVVIDKIKETFYMVKNANCDAVVWAHVCKENGIPLVNAINKFKIVFNSTKETPDLERAPKKYHGILSNPKE